MIRYIANACRMGKTRLEYTLKKAEHALVFKVDYQSDDITQFLAQKSYRAKNGLTISSSQFPEFKDSKNVIFLQGSDSKRNSKLDVTRFVGNMQRDSKYDMINEALAEFVDFVKSVKASQAAFYFPSYAPKSFVCYESPKPVSNLYWPNCLVLG